MTTLCRRIKESFDTEYEAIFNASQWILERIQNETKHES
jgi:hypothetical protein